MDVCGALSLFILDGSKMVYVYCLIVDPNLINNVLCNNLHTQLFLYAPCIPRFVNNFAKEKKETKNITQNPLTLLSLHSPRSLFLHNQFPILSSLIPSSPQLPLPLPHHASPNLLVCTPRHPPHPPPRHPNSLIHSNPSPSPIPFRSSFPPLRARSPLYYSPPSRFTSSAR